MKFLKYLSVFAYLKAHEGDHDEHGNPVMADKCNAEMLETGMCRGMFAQWTFDINSGKVHIEKFATIRGLDQGSDQAKYLEITETIK